MKTYLNTSFVLTSYLFYLVFTTGDSVSTCLQLLAYLPLLFVLFHYSPFSCCLLVNSTYIISVVLTYIISVVLAH